MGSLSPRVLPVQVCQGAKVFSPGDAFIVLYDKGGTIDCREGQDPTGMCSSHLGRMRLLPHGSWLQQLSPNPA